MGSRLGRKCTSHTDPENEVQGSVSDIRLRRLMIDQGHDGAHPMMVSLQDATFNKNSEIGEPINNEQLDR